MIGSVLQSSLAGMSAASVAMRVSANNLANTLTDGFKASRTVLVDQPTHNSGYTAGGTHDVRSPAQIGRGVQVAAIDRSHAQGSLVISDQRTDLALQGTGFFVLGGSGGERLYSRDGRFQFNANSELVSHSGHRVLGHNIDARDPSPSNQLEPIRIPQGQVSDLEFADDGTIRGRFSDGVVREVAKIELAEFSNPSGLAPSGNAAYASGINSGEPNHSAGDRTRIVSGAREMSNTEVSAELVNLTRFSMLFHTSLRVSETTHELLDELMHLKR
jgi:flagellar hook protein FlgE